MALSGKLVTFTLDSLSIPIINLRQSINKTGEIGDENTENSVMSIYDIRAKHMEIDPMQSYIAATDDFFHLTRLPMFGGQVLVNNALELFSKYDEVVLAMLINRYVDELTIAWARDAELDDHISLIDTFVDRIDSCFGDVPYEQQHPKYTCHPKVWFYVDVLPEDLEREGDFPW